MALITITTTVAVHQAGPDNIPFKRDSEGCVIEGVYDVVEIPPGRPVTLEGAEAEKLLARFGGKKLEASELRHAASIADETAPEVPVGPPVKSEPTADEIAAAKAKK